MTPQEVRNKVFQIVCNHSDFEKDCPARSQMILSGDIPDCARFHEDLGFDSLSVVEMTIDIEENFKIYIPETDMDTCKTFGDMVNMTAKALGNAKVNITA